MSEREPVTISRSRDDCAIHLHLDRPAKLNALGFSALDELLDAIEKIQRDDAVRVVTIRGAGGNFSAGADLEAFEDAIPEGDRQIAEEFLTDFHAVTGGLAGLKVPLVGILEGYALAGGLELLLACDLSIAHEDAVIGDQHANYGLLGGGGNTQRLPRRVGVGWAKELIFTGKHIDAETAKAIGLVTRVASADAFEEEVDRYVDQIASKGQQTLTRAKHLIELSQTADLDSGLELEKALGKAHMFSDECREGLAAFEEGRDPEF